MTVPAAYLLDAVLEVEAACGDCEMKSESPESDICRGVKPVVYIQHQEVLKRNILKVMHETSDKTIVNKDQPKCKRDNSNSDRFFNKFQFKVCEVVT